MTLGTYVIVRLLLAFLAMEAILWHRLPGIQSNSIQPQFSSVQFGSSLFPSTNYLFKNTNCNKQMNLCCLEMPFAGRSGEKILLLKKYLIYYVNN